MKQDKRNLWSYIDTGITKVATWCVFVAVFCIAVMMLLGVMDVIGDKFFARGIPSALEFIAQLNVVIVFLAVAYVVLERGHITMNVIENRISKRLNNVMRLVGYFLSILFCGFIGWRSLILVQRLIESAVPNSGQIRFPLWPFASALFFGCVLMTIAFILVAVRGIIVRPKE